MGDNRHTKLAVSWSLGGLYANVVPPFIMKLKLQFPCFSTCDYVYTDDHI